MLCYVQFIRILSTWTSSVTRKRRQRTCDVVFVCVKFSLPFHTAWKGGLNIPCFFFFLLHHKKLYMIEDSVLMYHPKQDVGYFEKRITFLYWLKEWFGFSSLTDLFSLSLWSRTDNALFISKKLIMTENIIIHTKRIFLPKKNPVISFQFVWKFGTLWKLWRLWFERFMEFSNWSKISQSCIVELLAVFNYQYSDLTDIDSN